MQAAAVRAEADGIFVQALAINDEPDLDRVEAALVTAAALLGLQVQEYLAGLT